MKSMEMEIRSPTLTTAGISELAVGTNSPKDSGPEMGSFTWIRIPGVDWKLSDEMTEPSMPKFDFRINNSGGPTAQYPI